MDNNERPEAGNSKTGMWVIFFAVVIIVAGGAYYFLSQDEGTNANSTNNANAVVNSVSNANKDTNTVVNENTNEASNENANSKTNTNATVDTSNWKSYSNSSIGFQISYPSDWETLERTDGSIAFGPQIGEFPEVSIKHNSSNTTSITSLKNSLQDMSLNKKSEDDITVDNLPVFLIQGTSTTTLSDGSEWYIQRAIVDDGQSIYEVNGDNAEDVYSEMLYSFKVL